MKETKYHLPDKFFASSTAVTSKHTMIKAASKHKKPASKTTPPTTKTTNIKAKTTETQPTPTSAKRKIRTSPIAPSKPHGKQVILSSSEEDEMPLIHRSKKKARAEKERTSQGLTIREAQEQLQQPSPPRIQTPAEIPLVEPVAGNVEEENVEQTETSNEMETEQPKGPTPDVAEDEDENEEMTESEAQEPASINESTSSVMSDQEFSAMKKTNPLGALKHLLSLSSSSSAMAPSASTTSLTSINQESAEELLQQLKAKVLEDNLLARIEEDPSESFVIKNIINKLFKCKPSAELISFMVEFGPIFETFALQLNKRSELSRSINQEAISYQELDNSFKVSQTNIGEIETQMAEDEQILVNLDLKIQHYNEEIKVLQTKLADTKQQKSLVQQRMEVPKSNIEAEATKALQYYEDAQQRQANISQLKGDLDIVESSIAVSIKVLDRLKLSLQNLH